VHQSVWCLLQLLYRGTCIHTYTYTFTQTHTLPHSQANTNTYTHTYMPTCLHKHTYTRTFKKTYMYRYTHTYLTARMHTFTLIYIHTHIHTYLHIMICLKILPKCKWGQKFRFFFATELHQNRTLLHRSLVLSGDSVSKEALFNREPTQMLAHLWKGEVERTLSLCHDTRALACMAYIQTCVHTYIHACIHAHIPFSNARVEGVCWLCGSNYPWAP